MKAIILPSIDRFKAIASKHKTESAEVCEEIGKEFGRNCYWMQYRYHPDRMRRALKSFQTGNLPQFGTSDHKWRYFLAILKKTI